jgi:putative phosphoribosyl transferase
MFVSRRPKAQDHGVEPLFSDRSDAGRQLAASLANVEGDAVVIGLARGGVTVAAEVARRLGLPLDALAVRKIGYPPQPEYGIGAATPGAGGVYLRTDEGLPEAELRAAVEYARTEADALDRELHVRHDRLDLTARTAVLVDDGLATGATMIAAVRWARVAGAARVVVAVPVASVQGAQALRAEADEVICPHEEHRFVAVGFWYETFTQAENGEVLGLLDELAG